MKEFEKWIKQYTARVEPQFDYLDAQVTWRAALEWVLSFKEPDHTDIFEVINPIWIKRELEDA